MLLSISDIISIVRSNSDSRALPLQPGGPIDLKGNVIFATNCGGVHRGIFFNMAIHTDVVLLRLNFKALEKQKKGLCCWSGLGFQLKMKWHEKEQIRNISNWYEMFCIWSPPSFKASENPWNAFFWTSAATEGPWKFYYIQWEMKMLLSILFMLHSGTWLSKCNCNRRPSILYILLFLRKIVTSKKKKKQKWRWDQNPTIERNKSSIQVKLHHPTLETLFFS